MPYKEKEIEKLYYSIKEVSEMFDVSKSLIRFWETEFDILKPKKSIKGNRLYSKKDIENFRLIYTLVKEKGYTLDGAKKKIKDGSKALENLENKIEHNHIEKNMDENINVEIIAKLQNIKSFLQTMFNEL